VIHRPCGFAKHTYMRTAAVFKLHRIVAAIAWLAVGAGTLAAEAPRVKITAAAVGLPAATAPDAPAAPICKFAAWAPVHVELELLAEVKEAAQIVVETPDADGVTTILAVPLDLANVAPGARLRPRDLRMLPYLRPAAGSGETTVTVRTANGTALSEPFRIRSLRPRDSLTYVVLALGNRLPGFELPKPTTGAGSADSSTGPQRGGRRGQPSTGSLLGIEVQAITSADLRRYGLSSENGVLITNV